MFQKTLLLLALAVQVSVSAQTTYHVDDDGSDANDGRSVATAKATIRAAADLAGPGDQILIQPGVYRENGGKDLFNTIFVPRSGSREGGYIRYTGVRDASGARPVLESSGFAAFGVQDRSYLIIEGLEIRPSDDNPQGLSVDQLYARSGISVSIGGFPNSHHLIFRDNYIHDFGGAGIAISDSDVLYIADNLVEHCAYGTNIATSGISLFQLRDFPVAGFTAPGEPTVPGAPELGAYGAYRTIVAGNVSRYNVNLRNFFTQPDNAITDGQGIILDDFRDVKLLGDNSLQTGAGSGADAYSGRSLLLGNACYGNGGPGVNAFLVERVDIVHNTLYDNAQTSKTPQPGFTINQTDGQLQVGGAQDVLVTDNILVNTNPEAGSTATTFLNGPDIGGLPVVFRSNLHHNTAGPLQLSAAITSPEDVLAAPGFRSARPLTDAETDLLASAETPFTFGGTPSSALREPTVTAGFPVHDLRLADGSPAIDAGTFAALGWTTLGAAPDLGAYESETSPADDGDPAVAIGETGRVSGSDAWQTVQLRKTYADPVVVLGPLTYADGEAATTRVRNVTPTSFEWRVEEWDYLDDTHAAESVAYVVLEAGFHELPGGQRLKAGHKGIKQDFWPEALGGILREAPVVLPQVVTTNEASPVSIQLDRIGLFGFDLRLREEEGADNRHALEQVDYVAIEPGSNPGEGAARIEAGRTGLLDFDTPFVNVDLAQDYPDADRLLFAHFQTTRGGDPWTLRYDAQGLTSDRFALFGQEEQSGDTETAHTTEDLGYWVVGRPGLLFAAGTQQLRIGDFDPTAGFARGLTVVNPARGGVVELTLPTDFPTDIPAEASLVNATGQVIARTAVGTSDRVQLDASDAPAGFYFVTVRAGDYRASAPVIIR